jgi:ubiquinone/menaquinone biosynthesis C-methylase UbiE
MGLSAYYALKSILAPKLRFNQAIYEEVITAYITPGVVWLDAGCGHRVLPPWRRQAERDLVSAAKVAVGCDLHEPSVRRHQSLNHRVVASLDTLPLRSESIDLITSNMVVEHLQQPAVVFREFARVLRPGGRVIIHTPNLLSHFGIAARFLPNSLKGKFIKRLDGRDPEDVFPTKYRANSPARLRVLMESVQMREDWCRMVANDAVLARANPLLAALELLYIRVTLHRMFRSLRVAILASFVKDP